IRGMKGWESNGETDEEEVEEDRSSSRDAYSHRGGKDYGAQNNHQRLRRKQFPGERGSVRGGMFSIQRSTHRHLDQCGRSSPDRDHRKIGPLFWPPPSCDGRYPQHGSASEDGGLRRLSLHRFKDVLRGRPRTSGGGGK